MPKITSTLQNRLNANPVEKAAFDLISDGIQFWIPSSFWITYFAHTPTSNPSVFFGRIAWIDDCVTEYSPHAGLMTEARIEVVNGQIRTFTETSQKHVSAAQIATVTAHYPPAPTEADEIAKIKKAGEVLHMSIQQAAASFEAFAMILASGVEALVDTFGASRPEMEVVCKDAIKVTKAATAMLNSVAGHGPVKIERIVYTADIKLQQRDANWGETFRYAERDV